MLVGRSTRNTLLAFVAGVISKRSDRDSSYLFYFNMVHVIWLYIFHFALLELFCDLSNPVQERQISGLNGDRYVEENSTVYSYVGVCAYNKR